MAQGQANNAVAALEFFITDEYGRKFYDSCKDVKFTSMNIRSMDFIGGGAQNYSGTFQSF